MCVCVGPHLILGTVCCSTPLLAVIYINGYAKSMKKNCLCVGTSSLRVCLCVGVMLGWWILGELTCVECCFKEVTTRQLMQAKRLSTLVKMST